MKNIFYLGVISFFFISCSSSKIKMGDYVYEIKKERVNTGDLLRYPKGEFGVPGDFSTFKWTEEGDSLPIISYSKMVYFNNKVQFGCRLKSQKLNQEKKVDSIYQKGELYIMNDLLVCVEKYYHGYNDNITLLRLYEQQKNGALRFKSIIRIPEDEYYSTSLFSN